MMLKTLFGGSEFNLEKICLFIQLMLKIIGNLIEYLKMFNNLKHRTKRLVPFRSDRDNKRGSNS